MQDWSCATLRELCAPEVLAQSHQKLGTARLWRRWQEPCWHCGVWGQPCPPRAAGPRGGRQGWDTVHSCCGWEGSSVGLSGVQWDGQGTWGRGGKRWGRAGRAQLSRHPRGLTALPGWHLHRDTAKVSLLCTGTLQRCPLSLLGDRTSITWPWAVSVHCPPHGSHRRRKAQVWWHRGHCPGSFPA